MKKSFIKWNGESFPVREINIPEEFGYNNPVTVADYDLYSAYEKEYEDGNKDATDIDNSIFYFFDSGFIASDPTDDEIIEKMIENGI